MSVNKAIILGNVTAQPEIRSTNDGREIANFSIATNEKWKDKSGNPQERVEYHRIVIFSQGLVGVVKNYVSKGTKIYIEGKIQTRKWTDNNGVDKYSTEIVLNGFDAKLVLLNSKKHDDNYNPAQTNQEPEEYGSDIPY
jgi:single-strand DNA-binding protein